MILHDTWDYFAACRELEELSTDDDYDFASRRTDLAEAIAMWEIVRRETGR